LAQGDYEDNYNKDAKPIPGCCNPLPNGAVEHCHKEHDVDGIPYCAIDAIYKHDPTNGAKEEPKKEEPKIEVTKNKTTLPPRDPNRDKIFKDKMKDVLS